MLKFVVMGSRIRKGPAFVCLVDYARIWVLQEVVHLVPILTKVDIVVQLFSTFRLVWHVLHVCLNMLVKWFIRREQDTYILSLV